MGRLIVGEITDCLLCNIACLCASDTKMTKTKSLILKTNGLMKTYDLMKEDNHNSLYINKY